MEPVINEEYYERLCKAMDWLLTLPFKTKTENIPDDLVGKINAVKHYINNLLAYIIVEKKLNKEFSEYHAKRDMLAKGGYDRIVDYLISTLPPEDQHEIYNDTFDKN